jgi:uncharacterized damage-inducible protein DinB
MSTPVVAASPGPADLSSAQKLTAQELDQARLFLQQTQNAIVGAIQGLSDAQWKFKPASDRWSIAENLGHIVTVLERVLGPVMDQLANAPAPPAGFDCKTVDAIVIHQFPTRLAKFSAPEFLHTSEQVSPSELLDRLMKNYARLRDYLESRPGQRRHVCEAPPLKAVSNGAFEVMDGYQWILAAAAHTERHAKQILEVKADANFPRI